MSETNRVSLTYAKESSTYGVPNAAVVLKPLRITAAPDFGKNPKSEVSTELRADRQVTDTILTNEEIGGSVNWELSYGAFDDLFEGVFSNDWVVNTEIQNFTADTEISGVTQETGFDKITVTHDSAANIYGKSKTEYSGHLLLSTGFSNAANNNRIATCVSCISGVSGVADAIQILQEAVRYTVEAAPPVGARLKVVGLRKKKDLTASAKTEILEGGVGTGVYTASITSAKADFDHFFPVSVWGTSGEKLKGTWVYINGLDANNDGWARIQYATAETMVFDIVPTTWVAVGSVGELDVYIYVGDRLTNFTTKKSYSLEQVFTDIVTTGGTPNPIYQIFSGVIPNTADFRLSAGAVLTGSFNFFGKKATIDDLTAPNDTRLKVWQASVDKSPAQDVVITSVHCEDITDVASDSTNQLLLNAFRFRNDVFNATSNFAEIREGGKLAGTSTTSYMMECSFQINNNLRRNTAVGVLGAANVAMGEWGVSGSMNFYFSDIIMMNKLLDQTATSFNIKLKSNKWMTDKVQVVMFEFPKIKFTSGNPSVSGKNADVMVNMGWQALMDETLNYTGLMQRFDYVDLT